MLVSTTLAGPGAEDIIVDALRSAAHLVEHHLVFLSGVQERRLYSALEAAPELADKVVFQHLRWEDDYGAARTAALRWAETFGATWVLTVDCDERMSQDLALPGADGGVLEQGYDALCVADRDIGYQKPRWLRCGVGLRWEWPCAERLLGANGKPPEMLRVQGSFWELPKDEAAERRRAERGVYGMQRVLEQGENAHARRHLAECFLILGEPGAAARNFERVVENDEAPQFERTWCLMRQAELACMADNFVEAREIAAQALADDPGLIQELGWIIAHANAQLKNYTAAALWCSYVLEAPWDYSRGGHRSKTWKAGAEGLLMSIERAAMSQRPQQFTRAHFAARDGYAEDYELLGRAINETLKQESALDLGAGNGMLLGYLAGGCGGLEVSTEAEMETPRHLRGLIDFDVPLERWKDWIVVDLVTCIEVAEHIPAERADELVDAIVSNSRRWVVFSAAQPGQGGVGHVNEQPPDYWIEKFEARGWRYALASSGSLRERLHAVNRCWWIPRNIMVFSKM